MENTRQITKKINGLAIYKSSILIIPYNKNGTMKILTILLFTFFSLSAYAQTKNIDNTKPFILGVIDEIQSKELSEKRVLNIYLPEGYNPNDTIKYPVVYLLDGSADEDFIHILSGYTNSIVLNG